VLLYELPKKIIMPLKHEKAESYMNGGGILPDVQLAETATSPIVAAFTEK
jgi:hypothetical protein